MKAFAAVIEKCPETRLYIGYVPGFSGAHNQAETLDELHANLQEVIEILLADAQQSPFIQAAIFHQFC
jgi:predicted RNase H-like HicB family nuclease